MNTKTVIKLGDKVSAQYGNVTVVGIVGGFQGAWVMLDFQEPQNLGNRTEDKGVVIRPCDRHTIKLIEAGPALSDANVGLAGDVVFLRSMEAALT